MGCFSDGEKQDPKKKPKKDKKDSKPEDSDPEDTSEEEKDPKKTPKKDDEKKDPEKEEEKTKLILPKTVPKELKEKFPTLEKYHEHLKKEHAAKVAAKQKASRRTDTEAVDPSEGNTEGSSSSSKFLMVGGIVALVAILIWFFFMPSRKSENFDENDEENPKERDAPVNPERALPEGEVKPPNPYQDPLAQSEGNAISDNPNRVRKKMAAANMDSLDSRSPKLASEHQKTIHSDSDFPSVVTDKSTPAASPKFKRKKSTDFELWNAFKGKLDRLDRQTSTEATPSAREI